MVLLIDHCFYPHYPVEEGPRSLFSINKRAFVVLTTCRTGHFSAFQRFDFSSKEKTTVRFNTWKILFGSKSQVQRKSESIFRVLSFLTIWKCCVCLFAILTRKEFLSLELDVWVFFKVVCKVRTFDNVLDD